MNKYLPLPALAIVSVSFAAPLACSSEDSPTPPNSAGAAGIAGAPPVAGSSPGGSGVGGSASGAGGTTTGMAGGGAGGTVAGAAGAAGSSTVAGGPSSPPGDAAQGKLDYASKACASCHGTMAEGSIGPNITGSMTAGIGAWSEADFTKAVRQAIGRDGQPFCPSMAPVPVSMLSDAQLKNIYTYLLTLKNDTVTRGLCP